MTQLAGTIPQETRRGRFLAAARDKGDALLRRLDETRMSRHDATLWRSARDMAGLGELVIGGLRGDPEWTPAHGGGPDPETIPLIPYLEVLNRGGFITDCSQRAESDGSFTWNTWVHGFAADDVLARLRGAVAGTPLTLKACRGDVHDCRHHRLPIPFCPRNVATSYWAGACPEVSADLWRTWWVRVEDPQPGRNDLMWPALAGALGK